MVRVLTINSVRLSLQKSNPPTILVEADGTVGTPGWKNLDLVPMEDPVSADGILDLEFVGTPPTGIVIQVIRPVTADFIITADVEKIVGVVVHSRTNSVTQLLSVATNPGGPSPGIPRFGVDPNAFTTLAIGEEGTRAIGETHFGGPIEKIAVRNAETLALIPSETWHFNPGESHPLIENLNTFPAENGPIGPRTFAGENGPDPIGPEILTSPLGNIG